MTKDEEVHAHLDRVGQHLRAHGRTAVADALVQQRDAHRSSKPLVVIAGEDKRGKSSLVNALLTQPGLSPVGVKVVTGSSITFFGSPEPVAEIWRYGTETPEPASVATAQRVATVDGNPGNAENISSIRIGLDLPLLHLMDLVDSPGVGGLASGHAALTLQSLASADALIFVVDASAPLRASELAFLRRAAGRLQAVVLVLTKTDLYPGWRTIQADDAAVLTEQAPRFAGAPFCAVSSASALRALATGDAEFAAEIRVESGIAALEGLVRREITDAVDTVRLQNLLRSTITMLAGLERDLRERRAASAVDGHALLALQEERERLRLLREDRATLSSKLNADFRKLTLFRSDTCARRVLEIRDRYQERIRTAKKEEFSTIPGELQAELTALAGELNELAAQRLAKMFSGLLDDVEQTQLCVRASPTSAP